MSGGDVEPGQAFLVVPLEAVHSHPLTRPARLLMITRHANRAALLIAMNTAVSRPSIAHGFADPTTPHRQAEHPSGEPDG
jgi:hypothetical protein